MEIRSQSHTKVLLTARTREGGVVGELLSTDCGYLFLVGCAVYACGERRFLIVIVVAFCSKIVCAESENESGPWKDFSLCFSHYVCFVRTL